MDPAAGGLCSAVEAAVYCILLERLLHDPTCVPAELPPTLDALAEPERQAAFIIARRRRWALGCVSSSGRVGGDRPGGSCGASAVARRGKQCARGRPWRVSSRWCCSSYDGTDPPTGQCGAIGQTMLGTGAPQLLIRLVLPSQPHGNDATALRLSGCWEWLLANCSRPHYSALLAFIAKVPQFGVAMRDSAHLAAHPAQAVVWRLLLATQGPRMGPAELLAEAADIVRTVVRGEGCEALGHTLELVGLMNDAAALIRALLLSAEARPIVAELDAMRARGAEEAQKKRVEAAGGTAPSGVDNGVEKASEMLQRAAIGLKQLSQTLVAPGKRD